MIRNRWIPIQLESCCKEGIDFNKYLFETYVSRSWEYAGGNHDHHLRFFKIVWHDQPSPEDSICYLCNKDIDPFCAFYITDYMRKKMMIKAICKHCFSKYDPAKRNIQRPTSVLPVFCQLKVKMD